jgi:hypothetical protein
MKKAFRFILVTMLAVISFLVFILLLRTPGHDKNWKAGQAVLPYVEFNADHVRIRNVRNFSYRPSGEVKDARYEDRVYDLNALESVWYGISHFAPFGLAHTFLSFGFQGGEYLALSIEARLEEGETYNPFLGLLRKYEIIYVLGDERDVIGVRTHINKGKVYLYELVVQPSTARRVLTAMLAIVNEIHGTPVFYNTLIDNCTTGIMRHAERLSRWKRLTDYRILLPGYSDKLAYEVGVIRNDVPFTQLQEQSLLDPRNAAIDDPQFSIRMRTIGDVIKSLTNE